MFHVKHGHRVSTRDKRPWVNVATIHLGASMR